MFWLKCCPRCGGDLYLNKDIWGRYLACVQCGHHLGEAEDVALKHSSGPRLPERLALPGMQATAQTTQS